MTSEDAHTIAEQIAVELGAVWGLAIRQRARFAGGRLDARQTYWASLRVARRRGWLRYQCGGYGVKAVYAPAGQGIGEGPVEARGAFKFASIAGRGEGGV